MKKLMILLPLFALTSPVKAQSEIGPEGHKLLFLLLFFLAAIALLGVLLKPGAKVLRPGNLFRRRKRVTVELLKNRLYYPDELELAIKNTGDRAVDMDRPVLIFSSVWLKRRFRIKGTNNAAIYPLFLDKGQSHTLNIDLKRFYLHDNHLKKLPKAKIVVHEVTGKRLGSDRVFLRKTLFRF